MSQGYFSKSMQPMQIKGKSEMIPKAGILANNKDVTIPPSPNIKIRLDSLNVTSSLCLMLLIRPCYFTAELVDVNPMYIILFANERMEVSGGSCPVKSSTASRDALFKYKNNGAFWVISRRYFTYSSSLRFHTRHAFATNKFTCAERSRQGGIPFCRIAGYSTRSISGRFSKWI